MPDDNETIPAVKDNPALVRLLFCQTLLEEYEVMSQPKLDQTELEQIEAEIDAYRQREREMDESQRQVEEPAFEGAMAKRIYELMNQAQTAEVRKIRADKEEKCQNLTDAKKRERAVDDAVVATVLGRTDDDSLMQAHIDGDEDYENSITPYEAEKLAAKTLRSALCLSGGGIRSATFNLGILQGLARHGLLEKFDYLSTVSGGGFIGGWLSAWIRREGLRKVTKALSEPPQTPLTPDPSPVEHLRIYSNYLSPQPGLLSADTWTLIATVFRNLVLNWLVFVPIMLAILLLPRIWASILLRSVNHPDDVRLWLGLGFLAGTWFLSYIGLNLPSSSDYTSQSTAERYKGGQGQFISRCLIMMVVSAAALSIYLWNHRTASLSWRYYVGFALAVMIVPLAICLGKAFKATAQTKRTWRVLFIIVATAGMVLLVQAIIGFLTYSLMSLALPVFNKYAVGYSVLSVPLLLLMISFQGLLITGFTSLFAKDHDQEWWARAGAWVLIVAVAWTLIHSLVLYGPLLILSLEATFFKMWNTGLENLTWTDVGKLLGTIAGIVSGAITLLGGFSAKTPANAKEAEKAGVGALVLGVATQLLAPVFLAFVIILLSLATDVLLISGPSQVVSGFLAGTYLPYPFSPWTAWHLLLIERTSFRLLVAVLIFLTLLGVLMGRLISTNLFSLQFMWRNRIIRAYLGASHKDRRPDQFTGFDSFDNLQMHELWPQPGMGSKCSQREDRPRGDLPETRASRKLFHVLNMALNLTGGEKLQWQDRKAESFTVSPLHAGCYWLGYRRSTHYGGRDGITLGASIAISGAFVSPNMGFMMNSPVVRFLMALFNVRFGWWLGNPGPAGDKISLPERIFSAIPILGRELRPPFVLDSPRLSVKPFLAEAVGSVDDKSPYVYLSDGGHFENLGLYEMVLRRCRFIVVSDATTDPDYSFESLAQSIRQIRVDLGVPIEISELSVGLPSQDLKSKYCAVGRIRYSCVDRDPNNKEVTDEDYDGVLIFIKPSLIGAEPRDVINYWQGRASFPQEVITDQWFSEAQFESYRTLGSSIIDAICDDTSGSMTLAALAKKARDHNQLNFRAFQEQIRYQALEHEFREFLQEAPVASYRSRVRRFMASLLS